MPSKERVEAAEVMMASALDMPSEASLVSDAQRRTIWCNRDFTEMTGYGMEEMFGRSCDILQGQDTDPKVVEEIRRCLDAGLTYHGSLLNYRRDGTTFWNHLTINPVRDSHGVLVNFVSVQRDVTEKVERERAFLSIVSSAGVSKAE